MYPFVYWKSCRSPQYSSSFGIYLLNIQARQQGRSPNGNDSAVSTTLPPPFPSLQSWLPSPACHSFKRLLDNERSLLFCLAGQCVRQRLVRFYLYGVERTRPALSSWPAITEELGIPSACLTHAHSFVCVSFARVCANWCDRNSSVCVYWQFLQQKKKNDNNNNDNSSNEKMEDLVSPSCLPR